MTVAAGQLDGAPPRSSSTPTFATAGSLLLHLVLVALVWFARPRGTARVSAPPGSAVEVDWMPPAPAPTPAPLPPAPPQHESPALAQPQPAQPQPTQRAAHISNRARTEPAEVAPGPQTTEPGQSTAPSVEPARPEPGTSTATITTPGVPPISASDLYAHVDDDAAAAAAQGHIDLGPRGGPPNAGVRHLFGRPGARTAEEVAAIASAPTRAALAEGEHMQPAGTMVHDRTVARRAAEAFDPTRSVAHLGALVRAAPVTTLPPVTHTQSAGEGAMNQATDERLGLLQPSTFTIPAPSYHLVRVEVEIDQDRAGAILATRVPVSSGSARFDAAALAAIREAMPEVSPLRTGAGRRTRWRFEVSDAASAASALIGGGNEGWTVIDEPSDGLRLRMRVRRTSVTALPNP